MKLPKFVDVKFYPGYSYGDPEISAPGRYVALGEDGKVYVFMMYASAEWEILGESQYDSAHPQGKP